MANYYVNKKAQSNRDHEVHKSGCSWLPELENRIYLGSYNNCKEVENYYTKVNGCYCSNDYQTS
ncbi:hypothetical protein [Polaribacter cellanae]|uniref:Uncharacterized protein n=1 Tax=Polaribacter cellanae TaxID=2818493 RepID=A0A975CRN5_9FLAO|nr:hypothetical protein [Polaribacter cellanae]QTE22677.1 hypothetical protein J3359_18105 [Polaribacter cellanae]